MARFTGGWIKLWRKAVEGDLPANVYLWAIWHWLLYSATWKPTKILWNGKQREIPPGTVVMGLSELSLKWECSPNTIKRWLKYLEESERIHIESCTRGTLVTIRNWALYQLQENDECTPTANELHTDCKPTANQLQLSEEVKKKEEKKGTEEIDPSALFNLWNENRGTLPEARELTDKRRTHAIARLEKNPDLSYWKEVITKMAASAFCKGKSGWKANFDFLLKPDSHVKAMEGQYDSPILRDEINTTPINLEDLQ